MSELPNELDRHLASALLAIGAVTFRPRNPYTWASGLRSPIYCDNRLTISYPHIRRMITDGFAALITRQNYVPGVIAGTATAGIPHAAWLAERVALPLVYVRSSPKGHGQGRRTEGRLEPDAPALLVEDLVSTGMSSLNAVDALRAEGARVLAVLAIFSYELPAAEHAFARADVPFHVLTTLTSVLDVASSEGHIDPDSREALSAWQRDPEGWSASHKA